MNNQAGFQDHTLETAPEATRRALEAAACQFGYVPKALARMAESPELVEAFHKLSKIWERTTLTAPEREVVVMVAVKEFGCEVCVAIHSLLLQQIGQSALRQALVKGEPLEQPRLEALRRFTQRALVTHGAVSEAELGDLLRAGFTNRQALEIVLGLATYTLTSHANRLTRAPLDEPLAAAHHALNTAS